MTNSLTEEVSFVDVINSLTEEVIIDDLTEMITLSDGIRLVEESFSTVALLIYKTVSSLAVSWRI